MTIRALCSKCQVITDVPPYPEERVLCAACFQMAVRDGVFGHVPKNELEYWVSLGVAFISFEWSENVAAVDRWVNAPPPVATTPQAATDPLPCPIAYYGIGACTCGKHTRVRYESVNRNPFGY